jgi:hypothetical protein
MLSHYEGERMWYLAMARWGDTGRLPLDLCQTSLELFQKACGNFEKGAAAHFQRISLLYWGIGDSEKLLLCWTELWRKSTKLG